MACQGYELGAASVKVAAGNKKYGVNSGALEASESGLKFVLTRNVGDDNTDTQRTRRRRDGGNIDISPRRRVIYEYADRHHARNKLV